MATLLKNRSQYVTSNTAEKLVSTDGPQIFTGLAAGFAATLPMTIGMLLMHRYFPQKRKKHLPPVEITENLSEKIAEIPSLDEDKLLGASTVAHFAYGAAVGALYVPVEDALPMNTPTKKGILFGLLVWAVSYFGLMPAVRLYPNAKDEPARMNILMILAHIIWGGCTGFLTNKLSPSVTKG